MKERSGSAGPILALAAAALIVVVAGVGSGLYQAKHRAAPAPAPRASGAQIAEGFSLMDMPAATRVHYRFAGSHARTYRQIPCYCGCDSFLAHRSLEDCFLAADGAGWDRHAAGCAVCIDESSIVRRLIARGLSPPAIRDEVVARYEMVGSTP